MIKETTIKFEESFERPLKRERSQARLPTLEVRGATK